MVTWQKTTLNKVEWNKALAQFQCNTVYQMYEWGEYKSEFGWNPIRLQTSDDQTMVQLLSKTKGNVVTIVWAPGGPIGADILWGPELRQTVQDEIRTSLVYIRLSPHNPEIEVPSLRSSGWQLSRQKMSTGMTMQLNLNRPIAEIEKTLTSNWRHNLKRGLKKKLKITKWENPDPTKALQIYSSMQEYKRLPDQYSSSELEALFRNFGERLVVYRADDENGNTLALRACVQLGARAWDILAATNVEGRKVYASYALLWSLIEDCKNRDIASYDLMGVDPIGNPGVYNFKSGTGAELVKYPGEWEWSSPKLLSPLVNFVMKNRGGSV
jgi:lipid II:glycine glycyltransferase (peptidoglycan interpeptide bridge formation enzyme)